MKKKISVFILSLLILAISIIGIAIGALYNIVWIEAISGAVLSIALGFSFLRLQDLFDTQSWQVSLRKHIRGNLIKSTDMIRISFAYLYRIKVNGKYLLVKNKRGFDKFQPVGGVYKCNNEEKNYLTSKKYCVADDNCIPIDKSSKNDYRMRLPAKNLKKFVKRFDKTIARENFSNLTREFNEELVKTKIIGKKNFEEINYKVCGRLISDISFSKHFQCYELLLADIIELIPNKAQENELIRLQSKETNNYYWAIEEEIKTCGVIVGTDFQKETITEHSVKILDIKTQQLLDLKTENVIYTATLHAN